MGRKGARSVGSGKMGNRKMGRQGKEKGWQVMGSERNDTEGSKCKEGGKKKE